MGPIRSLYEQEGDLERALLQPPGGAPVVLRPVQMSDCGERQERLGFFRHGIMQPVSYVAPKPKLSRFCPETKSSRVCFRKQRQRTQLSWAVRRR